MGFVANRVQLGFNTTLVLLRAVLFGLRWQQGSKFQHHSGAIEGETGE